MRHKRSSSSSSDSSSSLEHSSSKSRRHKSSKSKRNRSRSRSRSHDKKHRRSSRDKHRRRRHSSSSSNSSSSRSRSKSSKSKSNNKKHRHRSSSQSSNSRSYSRETKMPKQDKYRSKMDNMERERNFEFKESVDDLYKSELGRQHTIERLDKSDPGDGFRPQSFKSSRSSKKENVKLSAEQEYEAAVFGKSSVRKFSEMKTEDLSSVELIEPPIEVNVISSTSNSLMHESLFEDILVKEKRWKQKMVDLIKKTQQQTSNS